MSQAIPLLTRWGVTPTADLAYRALVTAGPQAAQELRRSLTLSARAAYEALDELYELGAAEVTQHAKHAGDRTWRGCPPETVVATIRSRQARLAQARFRLRRKLSCLDIADLPADPQLIRPIYDVPAARQRLKEIMATERVEHLAMNPETALSIAAAKAGAPAARAIMQRGITTRTLGVPGVNDESATHTFDLYAYGLEHRELPEQPIKMMIMDRRTAFLPLNPAANFSQGVWEVSDPAILDRLVSLFMACWDKATDAYRGWRPPDSLTPREKAVLTALSCSTTDAEAAAKLGLSVRTLIYALTDVMDRHGVRTRFQLGLALSTKEQQ